MGTKFRTMLAPIGLSTGDGRRFADGGITLASVPFSFEWVREREGGHDGAVAVGRVTAARVGTVEQAVADDWISADQVKGLDPQMTAVWATGNMYDDASREEMPRLAEDVAEAMHLMSNGTLGPSVDLDTFEGVPVMAGSDEPITWDDIEDYAAQHDGAEPKVELLITAGRVRAATLVTIPAFEETSRPLELMAEALAADAGGEGEGEGGGSGGNVAAMIASVAVAARPSAAVFDMPTLSGPTPITFDFDSGRVFGHIATWQTCHVGYSDVCVTAPRDADGSFAWFNRFPVETDGGDTVWAGRITVGGRHAGLSLNASATMGVYDAKRTAAHVRAYEDEFGIVVAGHIELDLTPQERATLSRRKVSGDWRETPAGLSLVEVLALSPGPRAHAEPGFPVPGTFSAHGRQLSLTAALGPVATTQSILPIDLAGAVRQALADDRRAQSARAALAAALDTERTAARNVLAAALTAGEG